MASVLTGLEVDEWQWLRFKPAGRGRGTWDMLAPSTEALLDVWPRALELEAQFGLSIRFDCALVPFLAAHQLPVAQLESLGITGCPGGESLWARSTNGRWTPCRTRQPRHSTTLHRQPAERRHTQGGDKTGQNKPCTWRAPSGI